MEGLVILVHFVLCVLVGNFAGKKGRSFFGWTVLSLLISPLLGFIIANVAGDLKIEE